MKECYYKMSEYMILRSIIDINFVVAIKERAIYSLTDTSFFILAILNKKENCFSQIVEYIKQKYSITQLTNNTMVDLEKYWDFLINEGIIVKVNA